MNQYKKELCIVVPIYLEKLQREEIYSLNRLQELAGTTEKIFFVAPKKLDISAYESYGWEVQRFSDKYFKSVDGYTKLLLQPYFYQRFENYEYILIYQTDALLLQPIAAIYKFMELPFDYFGAPWPQGSMSYKYSFRGISLVKRFFAGKMCYVGNGGFSLRNIQRTVALLEEKKRYTRIWNSGEDKFFAYHGQDNKCGFRNAPLEVAERFALEQNAKEKMKNGIIPIGLHAWKKFYPDLDLKEYEL